ncbi:MAG TPA: alpha/beta fold hydrolase [Acetobacteraceae bacterium]|nr:alpha/beta fold hydrolase [Acetobacteraceae bacterium]
MHSERLQFAGQDGQSLAARLDLPDDPLLGAALFAHCFTCGKDAVAASRIAAGLAARGIATLRFDFTGLGSSDGDFANTNFSSNLQDLSRFRLVDQRSGGAIHAADKELNREKMGPSVGQATNLCLVAAADHLRSRGMAPGLLIGHSLGGAAILAAAPAIPEARAVAVIGAPFDPGHVLRLLTAQLPEIEARGEAVVSLGGRVFTIKRHFIDDLRERNQAASIARLGKALLVMHSPVDGVVGIDNARQIFDAARHPKSFIALPDADHLLGNKADADYVAAVLAAWSSRYVGAAAPAAVQHAADAAEVVVEETGTGRLQQRISVGPHRFLADEPAEQGGLGSGPSPYDLLLAGLGACTAMTLRLFAEHAAWRSEGAHMGGMKTSRAGAGEAETRQRREQSGATRQHCPVAFGCRREFP